MAHYNIVLLTYLAFWSGFSSQSDAGSTEWAIKIRLSDYAVYTVPVRV